MEKKNNVFLCVTEYHVLLSIMLATEAYCSEKYLNRIILCNGGRFNDEKRYNYNNNGNIEYSVYTAALFRSNDFIQEILSVCTGTLFIFNMNNPHFLYLLYQLKRTKQANTAFIQEGLASYNVIYYSLRERLGRIKYDITVLKKAGIKDKSFYFYGFGPKGRFGRVFDYYEDAIESSLVDSFWLTLPEEAKYGKGKVRLLPNFTNRSIIAANNFFRYQQTINLQKNDILFIDQRIEGSFEFVSELSKAYPNTNIYIKLHPRTRQDWAEEYKKIPNVIILTALKGIPVELFLLNLKNVIVLTSFSSALLINNPSCRYYYTFMWHLEHGYDIENNNLYTPGEYIGRIKSISEIELF